MFDILVYLFENYYDFHSHPEPQALARKLTLAGFDEAEVTEALEWLGSLKQAGVLAGIVGTPARVGSLRLWGEDEEAKLNVEARGFLLFLENAGVLDPTLRELVVDRAMNLDMANVSLDRFKVIVLMVLWSQDVDLDALIIEELLSSSNDPSQLH